LTLNVKTVSSDHVDFQPSESGSGYLYVDPGEIRY
jgi:hypothetical protein